MNFAAADGLLLSCIDYGGEGGTPVLLMHGAAAHSRWWDFTAPALTGRYHVLALDRRGHGDSQWSDSGSYEIEDYAADLHAVIGNWGMGKPFLVAHSGGGLPSIMYAARYPENVSGLVLMETRPVYDEEMVARMRNRDQRPPRTFESREEALRFVPAHPTHRWRAARKWSSILRNIHFAVCPTVNGSTSWIAAPGAGCTLSTASNG